MNDKNECELYKPQIYVFWTGKKPTTNSSIENNWLKRRTSERDSDRAERIINVKKSIVKIEEDSIPT